MDKKDDFIQWVLRGAITGIAIICYDEIRGHGKDIDELHQQVASLTVKIERCDDYISRLHDGSGRGLSTFRRTHNER